MFCQLLPYIVGLPGKANQACLMYGEEKIMASYIFDCLRSYQPPGKKTNVLLAHDSCSIFALINYDCGYLLFS